MATEIDKAALEKACKDIIETILFCLPNAYKGTVYTIGPPPEMVAVRITSGVINEARNEISWGLPEASVYNSPGRPWREYRDEPGRPLEAMGWCVERQKSWTAEDPENDSRSVRLQVEGVWEDRYHMEPVLTHYGDFFSNDTPYDEPPRNHSGDIIWRGSAYAVVAVIKIHFQPNTIKIGGPETKVIKRLSRALGTELLSYKLRHQSFEAMRQLAEDKMNACNILADSLRNAVTKTGLIFSLIKSELGFLRQQWEGVLLRHSDQRGIKQEAIRALNETLMDMGQVTDKQEKDLLEVQNRFLELSLPPDRGIKWVRQQIEDRWNKLLSEKSLDAKQIQEVSVRIEQLKRSLYLGKDPNILAAYTDISEPLKSQWVDLIYRDLDHVDFQFLAHLIQILGNRSLKLPFKERSKKSFIGLKNLAEVMDQLEKNTNVVLRQVLNGYGENMITHVLEKNGKSLLGGGYV